MAQDGKSHDRCQGMEEDLLRKRVVRAGGQPRKEPDVVKSMEKGLCSLQMGATLCTAELQVSWAHWKCGSEQVVRRGHLGTSAETQLQWLLKSPTNTSTCLEASHGAAQGMISLARGPPAIRRPSSSADHPKVSLALSCCLLCALTTQRVDLSLPISCPSPMLCR